MGDNQFSLRAMISLMLIGGLVMAFVMTNYKLVESMAETIIWANVLGAIVALIVTHVMGMPRDGSYRHGEESED